METTATRVARDLHMVSALTRRVLEGEFADPAGTSASFTQLVILKWLDAATPRRAQDVARFLSASAPAATQILARLRKKGLVRSRPNRKDRRADDLFLTPKARALITEHDSRNAGRLETLLSSLPSGRRNALAEGLETAIELLLADHPSVADMCLQCGAHASPRCVMRQHGFSCPTERDGIPTCGAPRPVPRARNRTNRT